MDKEDWPATRKASKPGCQVVLECLEQRELLATVTVNAGQVVRPVNTRLLGVNVAWWDSDLNTSRPSRWSRPPD